MTQERNLTVSNQSIMLSPQDVVLNATLQSKLLMDIVAKTGCFQLISGKRYLQVEAWETIGAFNRVHAVTESVTAIITDGAVVGYDAKVSLLNQDGVLVGSAIMPCYFTENACKGKEGDAKDKACKSAAQTFATSKAYRMNYSYIAILAGYEPTPAEEMTGEVTDDRPANLEHWCEEHQTKFFKRGKMKVYAHPIGDTGKWCSEQKEQPKAPDIKQAEKDIEELFGDGEIKPPPKPSSPQEELYDWIAGNMKWANSRSVRSWIINKCQISEQRILDEPEKVKKEVAELMGWSK